MLEAKKKKKKKKNYFYGSQKAIIHAIMLTFPKFLNAKANSIHGNYTCSSYT